MLLVLYKNTNAVCCFFSVFAEISHGPNVIKTEVKLAPSCNDKLLSLVFFFFVFCFSVRTKMVIKAKPLNSCKLL